jgi:hypothetical protein
MAKIIDVELSEGFLMKDQISSLITVTSTSIDLASGASATTTTTLPPDILNRSMVERGVAISDEIIKKDSALKEIEADLPAQINRLIEKEQESAALKSVNHYFYINCNIYGSVFGGDIQSVNMSFTNTWNMMKDSIDTDFLKKELQMLLEELPKRAKEDSHYEKLAEVSQALYELNKANGPGMLRHLKKAGKWVLDVALETGKDIAAKVISEVITKGM